MSERPITLTPGATIGEAIALVSENEIRHLPIVDGTQPVAMVSDRDLRSVDGLVAVDATNAERVERIFATPVLALASQPPLCCRPDTPAHAIIDQLLAQRVDALLVTSDEGALLGIVSVVDLLRAARDRFEGAPPGSARGPRTA